ncbi:tRNA-uridine aminocarboxypropyltransferase [Vibrio sp. VB16]|uniref:tRNA-uridine aminocarboxypropyltransferase n=1 Tax=Vibrio sp. VB16 TaxID=2785746 RepID=UPI00189CFC3E|nr:DTW domain-containing protein [Vibrio sp. VB16]UGA54731.1 DTW domain-containing protein [Vibrio sp. VB16]
MSQIESQLKPCLKCGFKFNCLCEETPYLESKVNIALLMHPNEIRRETNTGKLVSKSLPETLRFTWDRVTPPQELIQLINSNNFRPILLFPSEDSTILDDRIINKNEKPPLFIILDSTWQEANKMIRKSPWLQTLTMMKLSGMLNSDYSLRRNQDSGHLCTCETACELLRLSNEPINADRLIVFFHHYLAIFKADRSGHKQMT